MTPKTILLISRCPPYPLHLGDRLIIWHLARELSQKGYTLDLLAFAQMESDFAEIAFYAPYFRHITLIAEPKRSPIAYLQRVFLPAMRFPKNAKQSWSPEMWQAIETHIATHNYDGVHLFGSVQVYEFFHALQHKPMLITPYESFSLFLERLIQRDGGWLNRARQVIARQFEKFMFVPYKHITVLAQADKNALLHINPKLNVHVISNGIELTRFGGDFPARHTHTLLFVGNYEYAPNVDAVLFLANILLPQVRQKFPNTHLLIVGNAPPASVQSLASAYISVTGYVEDVRPYYAQGTLFVCPLRVGAGIKNKVLEALAMGIPVIATPIAVDGIAVEHGQSAWIGDADTLAQGIITLLQDASLRETFSRNGRMLIEDRYSWQFVAEEYARLYALF